MSLPGAPGAFGQPGANTPALTPITPTGGGQTPEPQPDSGNPQQDTGTTIDTGTKQDTSGGGECAALLASSCSADPTPTSSQISTCNSQISGSSTPSCPSQWRAFYQCYSSRRVCDSSTNTTDQVATQEACSTEAAAVSTCAGA